MLRTKALGTAIVLLALAGAIIFTYGGAVVSPGVVARPAPFPFISLPRLKEGAPPFTTADLGQGIVVVNFFSSWCGPCRVEHPLLMELKEQVVIIGINYMDKHADAVEFLDILGNPYQDIAVDGKGELGGILGIDSVPRTLVIAGGRVVYAHKGRLTPADVEDHLRPLLKKLRKRA